MRRRTYESRLPVCDSFKGQHRRIERQPLRNDVDMSRLKGFEVSLGLVLRRMSQCFSLNSSISPFRQLQDVEDKPVEDIVGRPQWV